MLMGGSSFSSWSAIALAAPSGEATSAEAHNVLLNCKAPHVVQLGVRQAFPSRALAS